MLSILVFNSCSEKDNDTQTKQNVELKFEDKETTDQKAITFNTYQATILSTSPLKIESEDLEVIEVVHSITNEAVSVIVKKERLQRKSTRTSKVSKEDENCNHNIAKGYWYDENDCFVYGTIITADNCEQLFIPADKTTQLLMNDCGWSNVA